MNKLKKLFSMRHKNLLSVYFTAGYPQLESTIEIVPALQEAGADIVEIGMPFSDPVADGPVIQESSKRALANGMTLKKLFAQLRTMKHRVHIPLVLMGYINPVLQYGIRNFCADCANAGIDGLILPDMPAPVYETEFAAEMHQYGLSSVFLVTPETSDSRIRYLDRLTTGFIYLVSDHRITGGNIDLQESNFRYFQRIQSAGLSNPTLIGFGIGDHLSFTSATQYASGAIIGSAFIKMLEKSQDHAQDIIKFVRDIKVGPETMNAESAGLEKSHAEFK